MNNFQDDDQTQFFVSLKNGTIVSHYRIVEKIGAGGMGEVYLAEDSKLNRRVALKFLPSTLAQDNDIRLRFTREAQAVAKLEHPNIITIYEVSEFNNRPFFAMQYVEGKTTHYYCYEEKLPLDKLVLLFLEISQGLAKAHSVGITHRDIKSANIILDKDYHPKILDFGLATMQGSEMLTKVGTTLGTLAYMSPEQAQGEDIDHRSDIFSLGVVFYELLAGNSPFKGNSDAATLHNVLNNNFEPLSTHNPDVPHQLEQIVTKCLHKNRIERYQSTDDLVSDIQKVISELTNKKNITGTKDSDTSIAVLPFANMSADPENEFFADGLTEELLNVLAKNPDLKVIGRTSSFAFKNKQEDLRGIGSKLGVTTILEGSVRKSGNRVRITAQLVKTSDGFHLWSETYDRVIEDIFAVQDEIAEAVAKELDVTLLGKSKEKKIENIKSYEFVLKADQVTRSWSRESSYKAIEFYQKAIDLEPNNARAQAGIARTYFTQAAFGFNDHQTAYRLAKNAALRAVKLDDELADAHEALGYIRFFLEFHFEEGWNAFQKALELAPNNSKFVNSVGTICYMLGNFEEGERLLTLSVELDPLSPEAHFNLGKLFIMIRNHEDGRNAMLKALKLSKGMAGLYGWLSSSYYIEEKYEDALKMAQQEISEGHKLQALAISYHGLGMKEESDANLNKLLNAPDRDAWAFQLALVYAARKEVDNAFKWLDTAFNLRDAGIPQTKYANFLDSLYSDPRWAKLLKQIGYDDFKGSI